MIESQARASARTNFDTAYYADCLRMMMRIRAFEEVALEALREKLIHGAIHPSIGQEAVAVGVCRQLRADDILLSTHRGHGHTLAKGADVTAMMCELFGKAGGTCQGKGGSMHIADFKIGMLGANGVVAANITIAAGAAHAVKLKGEDRIVACFFGDGAVNRGPFLEGLNWAKIYALPVLFICEDNGYAATTRSAALTAGPGPAARAESLGVPATTVDGNDIVAMDEAARDLIKAVRGGAGPRFLLAKTYRLTGHTGADPALYRPQAEVEERRRRDPLLLAAALLGDSGVGAEEIASWRELAQREMRAAYAVARAAPWPEARLAFADVQDIGDPQTRAYCWPN
ncbi:MAG: thiamine pyrophosphate-dependent dehydrogenase E1 component subunit alpha [Gammaproteobacteria bacterium]